MPSRLTFRERFNSSGPLLLFCILFVALFFFGGASRADVIGQFYVRAVAWLILIVAVVARLPEGESETRPLLRFISAIAIVVLLQLLPLPPAVWEALPGRGILAAQLSQVGVTGVWRPMTLSPGSTVNALGSLVVIFASVVAGRCLTRSQHKAVLFGLILVIVAACVWALGQLLQIMPANPFLNSKPGQFGGPFANRNHLALLLVIGLLLIPSWMVLGRSKRALRFAVGLSLAGMIVFTLLGIGSRAGLALAPVALVAGLAAAWRPLLSSVGSQSRNAKIALATGIVFLLAAIVLSSLALGRATTIDRLIEMDVSDDLRTRALPTVLAMIRAYFPIGIGFGAFDPAYRIAEPIELLNPSYFNHAHNDALEIILEGGVFGALIAIIGIVWWARRSLVAWKTQSDTVLRLDRLGSGILLLIMLASAADYPARTPIIMSLAALGAIWLSSPARN